MKENISEKNISDRLIALRAVNKLSLEEVAIKLGVHRETVRRYENHPKNMNIDVLVHFGICVCKYKLFFVIVHVHGKNISK